MVVLPHGGPHVRDTWSWDPEVQFLTSRGYAVFQPNYRGSTGFDWIFPAADRWDFHKMHNDVTDGVKTMLKTGLIARDRIAIMGTSFGGYLALCGAAFEPDLYRCAISNAGVFDWEAMIREVQIADEDSGRAGILRRNLGDPSTQKDLFDSISPIRHVNQIKIPVFVSHGKVDSVVYVGQAKRLISELEKHGIAHEVFLASGEGHGMRRTENEEKLYSKVEAFLAKHLSPAP
jgi:dipeptidyl aminopeptidase/acylaminoacyl peptidase